MNVLTKTQVSFIDLFKASELAADYYLSGGTALAEFYFQHRLSDDLDFFSDQKIPLVKIQEFVESAKNALGFHKIEYVKKYDRNIFILKNNEILKTEFTLYPFKKQKDRVGNAGFFVDSLDDIGANKIFAMLDRVEAKDFVDMFFFFKNGHGLLDLQKKAEAKFEMQIDPITLGSAMLPFRKIDFSAVKLLKSIDSEEWRQVFTEQIKSLNAGVLMI